MSEDSPLEVDLLLLFYTFSNQYGEVDIERAREWALSRLGVHIPNRPFTFDQKHADMLMDKGVVPDIRLLMQSIMQKKKSND